MNRLVAVTALALLLSLSDTRGGTPIEQGDKCCQVPELRKAGVGPYISVFGGANVDQSGEVDKSFFDWNLEPNTGWFAGLKIGYGFKTNSIFLPAIELEGFYNRVDFEKTDKLVDGFSSRYISFKQETTYKETFDVHVAAIMLNGLMRFDLGRFRPYIGGGIGVAHVWFQGGKFEIKDSVEVRSDFLTDSLAQTYTYSRRDAREWSFAAQGIAGFEILATDRIAIFAEYKALWLRDAVMVNDYVNHLIGGGLKFYF